jgi:hypothetical protein
MLFSGMASDPAEAASTPQNSDANHLAETKLLNQEELATLFTALKEGGETLRRKAAESDAAFEERIRPLREKLEKPFSVAITVKRDSGQEGFTYDRKTQKYTFVRYYRPLPFNSKSGVYWFPLYNTRMETSSEEVYDFFSLKKLYLRHILDTNTGIAIINCEKTKKNTNTGPFRYIFSGRYVPDPGVSLLAVIDCVPVLHAADRRAEPQYTLEESLLRTDREREDTVSRETTARRVSVTFISNIINVNIVSLRIVNKYSGEILAAEEF